MKFLIALAGGLLASSLSFAADVAWPNPETFCTGDCAKQMQAIADDFRDHGQVPNTAVDLTIASGACYHINPQIDPNYTHYGVSVIGHQDGVPTLSSLFSFFPKEDPWANMSSEEVLKSMKDSGSKITPAEITEKEARIVFVKPQSALFYWVRSYPEAHQLLLVSKWDFQSQGANNYIFCRLNVH